MPAEAIICWTNSKNSSKKVGTYKSFILPNGDNDGPSWIHIWWTKDANMPSKVRFQWVKHVACARPHTTGAASWTSWVSHCTQTYPYRSQVYWSNTWVPLSSSYTAKQWWNVKHFVQQSFLHAAANRLWSLEAGLYIFVDIFLVANTLIRTNNFMAEKSQF